MRTRLQTFGHGRISRRWLAIGALVVTGGFAVGACNFDITNTNQPTLSDLENNPTRVKLTAAATGLFASARGGIQALIWRLGSMGREGVNLLGNNEPDYQEPFYGLVQAGGSFGGTLWLDRYAAIRSANIYIDAVDKAPDLTAEEKAASRGMGKTLKALAFMYVIETRAQLGAPVDVDRPLDADPAPFVSEDSVWSYIIGTLNDAQTDLAAAGSADFPFPVPPGLADFGTPGTFVQFNRALAAKAYVLRATDGTACAGSATTCYTAALTALGGSFLDPSPANLQAGAYFDYSTGQGDISNGLADPVNGLTFFALHGNLDSAQLQTNGTDRDQRVLDKIIPAGVTQIIGGIPIVGDLKFSVYFTGGQADPNHSIPIVKNEELVLLDAEANWFAGSKAQALTDIDLIRQNSGNLPATTLTTGSSDAAFVSELLYNRRYSLLWEQGTRWIDYRRFGRLGDIELAVAGGNVPPVMPVPKAECDARNLPTTQALPDVVTCTPLTP
jgi:starch-binding outer membrane protein, SusD/RagB family